MPKIHWDFMPEDSEGGYLFPPDIGSSKWIDAVLSDPEEENCHCDTHYIVDANSEKLPELLDGADVQVLTQDERLSLTDFIGKEITVIWMNKDPEDGYDTTHGKLISFKDAVSFFYAEYYSSITLLLTMIVEEDGHQVQVDRYDPVFMIALGHQETEAWSYAVADSFFINVVYHFRDNFIRKNLQPIELLENQSSQGLFFDNELDSQEPGGDDIPF